MIDRWQQLLMNYSSSFLCLDPHRNNNSNNSSSSYCSSTSSSTSSSSSNNKSNPKKMNNNSQREGQPAAVPVERKNSIGLMEALLADPPFPPSPSPSLIINNNNHPASSSSYPPHQPPTTTSVPNPPPTTTTTVDDVWNNIVAAAGGRPITCKQEQEPPPDTTMMTLEDFLAKAAGASAVDNQLQDVKPSSLPIERLLSSGGRMLSFDNPPDDDITTTPPKRSRQHILHDPLQDKAAQQRQRRMIKNRESAARSRERKQAYQAELESLAFKLEEENETLIKAKEEKTRARYKQLMDNIIPVTEKRRPTRYVLKKVRSMEW